MVMITEHAKKRMKERNGLPKKSLQRIADKVLEKGIRRENIKGCIRQWMDNLYSGDNNSRDFILYGHMVYITGKDDAIVTVLHVPRKLVKACRNCKCQ